jgi:hypothetical protein
MPIAYNPSRIDFSALGEMGQNIGGALGQHNLGTAMQGAIKNGVYDYDQMISVLAGRNPMLAAKLATQKSETDADNEYRRGMLAIAQHKASQPMPGRIVNLPDENGVLQPFERSSDGQITRVQQPGVGQRYKPMSVNDITKLSDEGGKAKSVAEFASTFSDDYGGYGGGVDLIAQTKMLLSRAGWANQKNTEAATWWQGYDKYKNVVRNDLFGSALTPSEQEQFTKADIAPGMDPGIIRSNLALQNKLIQTGLARKSAAFKAQGYNPRVIDEAYGVQPGQQDAAAPQTTAPAVNRVRTVPIAPPVQAGVGSPPPVTTDLPEIPAAVGKARKAMELGHPPEAIEQALLADKVPPEIVQQIMQAIRQGQ